MTALPEAPRRQRSGAARVFFGLVWTVALFLVAAFVTAAVVAAPAGDNEALRKQLARDAGRTTGPWLLLGSIGASAVLGALGLLPGTGRMKR
jgi:hypothetical protein